MIMTNDRLTAYESQKLRQTDFSRKPGFVRAETVAVHEVLHALFFALFRALSGYRYNVK